MSVKVNKSHLEDRIINPLNNILLLSYGSDIFKDVELEIQRVVTVLEQASIIKKRTRR